MTKRIFAVFALLVSLALPASAARYYSDILTNSTATPIPGATVKVLIRGSSTLAQIFSDNGVTPKANPFLTDANGRYEFWAADGPYTLQFTTLSPSGTQIVTTKNITLGPSTVSPIPPSSGGGTTGPQGPQGPPGPQGLPKQFQEEGVSVPARSFANFIGAGVTAVDDLANDRTNITISAGGAAPNSFTIFDPSAGTNVEPDSPTDTIFLVGEAGISVTGTAGTDTIAIGLTPGDIELGPDTTGGYADSATEGGSATTGDSATAFFSTGTLEAAIGGTGQSTPTDDNALIGNGSTWEKKTVPDCTDTGGNHLNYTQSTNLFSCGTTGGFSGDHGTLDGLTDDDHAQYGLLAGRSGGQHLICGTASGDDCTIESTSNGTKGDIFIKGATSGNASITATDGSGGSVNLRLSSGGTAASVILANNGHQWSMDANGSLRHATFGVIIGHTGGDLQFNNGNLSPSVMLRMGQSAGLGEKIAFGTTGGVIKSGFADRVDIRNAADNAAGAFQSGSTVVTDVTNSAATLSMGGNGGTDFKLGSAQCVKWSSTTSYNGSLDGALCRDAANILKLTDGSSGIGQLTLGNLYVDDEKEFRLGEEDANGSNYLAFKAPAAVTTNQTCTLVDGAAMIPDSCVGDGVDDGGVGSGDVTTVGDCSTGSCFSGGADGGNSLQFEGSTADGFETTLTVIDPTADRTITFPNADSTPWATVFKTTTETIDTDTTLNADATLLFPVAANTSYSYRMEAYYSSGTTPDFKFQINCPASPTLVHYRIDCMTPGATACTPTSGVACAAPITISTTSGTVGGWVAISGTIQNGANAGDLAFEWAQGTSDGGSTSVLKGSYIEWKQLP